MQAAAANLDRVAPEDLAAEVTAGALVVDTRPLEQRQRDGELPGAVVVDRNVLEWRLDPTCPYRLPECDDIGRRVVLVCNEGYSSVLAAATLQQLGLSRATDLEGGFQAWLRQTESSAPLIEEHRELAELLATVDVGDPTDQQRIRLAVTNLHEHISKEEDGLFPASLIALSGRGWDEAMAAWHDAHPGAEMMSD